MYDLEILPAFVGDSVHSIRNAVSDTDGNRAECGFIDYAESYGEACGSQFTARFRTHDSGDCHSDNFQGYDYSFGQYDNGVDMMQTPWSSQQTIQDCWTTCEYYYSDESSKSEPEEQSNYIPQPSQYFEVDMGYISGDSLSHKDNSQKPSKRPTSRKPADAQRVPEVIRVGATVRERARMHMLNDAFDELRRVVPRNGLGDHQRLSKIATLRLAIQYISALVTTLSSSGVEIQKVKGHCSGDRRGKRRCQKRKLCV